jgi:arginase
MSGIKAALPDQTLGVIWIDAHADLHSPYTSPSGNIHGMPLAAALNDDNLECQINEVGAETEKYWNALKNIGLSGAKMQPQHLTYFGVRDTEQPEDVQMAKLQIKNYKVEEVRYRGLELCVAECLERLKDCDNIYISFDVDSMDCDSVSYGTGTPVPKGFDPEEIKNILKNILKSKKVICLEVVEVNPLLDTRGNKMAETAFHILDDFTKEYLES